MPTYLIRRNGDQGWWRPFSELWKYRRIVWAADQTEAFERASRRFRGELRVERIAIGHSSTGARIVRLLK